MGIIQIGNHIRWNLLQVVIDTNGFGASEFPNRSSKLFVMNEKPFDGQK